MLTKPGGLVYGTILVATLLAAESAVHETYGRTVAAVVAALVAYWLTLSYSEYAGERLLREEPLEHRALARAALHELPVLYGAAVPLVVLLITWAVGAPLATAVGLATWAAVGSIVGVEVISGARAGLTGREFAEQAAVGALLGLLVLAIRLLLH